MQQTTLYFVRHGETDYNLRRIMQGRRINGPLNNTGRRQARALARRFADTPFDAIYASSLRRAEETAAIIAAHHPDTPFHTLDALQEMSWGVYEGQPAQQVADAFDAITASWQEGRFEERVEGGESILEVQQRALEAMDHILSHHAGEQVLVVTHGRFLRVLLATLLDDYGLKRMQDIQHANTAVNRILHTGGGYEADLLNCTAHLDEVETIMVE